MISFPRPRPSFVGLRRKKTEQKTERKNGTKNDEKKETKKVKTKNPCEGKPFSASQGNQGKKIDVFFSRKENRAAPVPSQQASQKRAAMPANKRTAPTVSGRFGFSSSRMERKKENENKKGETGRRIRGRFPRVYAIRETDESPGAGSARTGAASETKGKRLASVVFRKSGNSTSGAGAGAFFQT